MLFCLNRKLPPFSWLINRCCPNLGQDSCLGYSGGDFSSTLTSSVTTSHSIRRNPGSHLSRTSLRRSGHHHVTLLWRIKFFKISTKKEKKRKRCSIGPTIYYFVLTNLVIVHCEFSIFCLDFKQFQTSYFIQFY